MSVVHCKEVVGRGGDRQKSGDRKRYTRVFQLLTDDPTDGSKTVRDFVDLPNYGDEWEQVDASGAVTDTDADARVVEKRAVQSDENNHQNWMVTVEYAGVGDPTTEPPRVSWSSEKYQESVNTDEDTPPRAVTTSAGELYEAGMTRDRTRRILLIERNVLTWNPALEDEFIDTTNALVFLADRYPPGFDVGLCKIDDLTSEVVFWENYPDDLEPHYYRVTAKVSIDRRGHNASLLDAGYKQLVFKPDLGIEVPANVPDFGGQHSRRPILLDGAGHELTTGADPVYRSFIKYISKDWSPLAYILEY